MVVVVHVLITVLMLAHVLALLLVLVLIVGLVLEAGSADRARSQPSHSARLVEAAEELD